MKKILIIEDDPIVSHIYRSRLEKEGFEVEISPDGQAGYYRLHEWKPDAMLLDLMLPKLNGVGLLKKIRAVREFEKLPVIVFTNAYVSNMIHEAFSAGASAVYNKSSVTPRQIIDVFGTLLSPPDGQGAGKSTELKPPVKTGDDASFQKQLLASFSHTSATACLEMRKLLQEISKADEPSRPAHLEMLYGKVRSFSSSAGLAGLPYIAKLGAAAEALVRELVEKPKTVTTSTLRTIAQAIDFFGELSRPGLPPDLAENPPINILIVDDELLSRRAIVYALEKAFLKGTPVEDAEAALAKTKTTKFDLIFLDVHLPQLNGFQVCDKLRESGANTATPIIFVTASADFQARAQSTLRGASDLLAKPFMFIELTVKALTFSLRHRLDMHKQLQKTKSSAPNAALETASVL